MPRVSLYAVGIDEVRDLVGATPETAARVRPLAAELWPATGAPAPQGWWARLTGRGTAGTSVDPARPTPTDVDAVLEGRFVAPDRAPAAWQVVEGLVERLAHDKLDLDLAPAEVEAFDYALAKAGAPAEAGLGRLLRSDARLGLTPAVGRTATYLPHAQALRAAALLGDLTVEEPHTGLAEQLRAFLGRFGEHAERGRAEGRPEPDLVAFTA